MAHIGLTGHAKTSPIRQLRTGHRPCQIPPLRPDRQLPALHMQATVVHCPSSDA